MKDFLEQVLQVKQQEVRDLRGKSNRFSQLFADPERFVFIGEVKPKSPTMKAVSNTDFVGQAQLYSQNGIDAVSVLTDSRFFGGSVELLAEIRHKIHTPILMKDFIVDESQVISGVKAGADSVLLIVDLISPARLTELVKFCRIVGVEPLVEIQDEEELEIAMKAEAAVVGVNSRNLRTLELDTDRALRVVKVAAKIVSTLFLSGVESHEDVLLAQSAGARGVLVGSTLMKSTNVVATLKKLKGEL